MINNLIRRVLFRYPRFGNIIANLKYVAVDDNWPATAATNGKTLYYRQDLFTDFSNLEQEFIISHEIMHVVFAHLNRSVNMHHDLVNFVADAIINQLLLRDGLPIYEGFINNPDEIVRSLLEAAGIPIPEELMIDVDVLNSSMEELYRRYFPYLDLIAGWMGENTYHLPIIPSDVPLTEEERQALYDADYKELMEENDIMREPFLTDYHQQLAGKAGISPKMEFPGVKLGKRPSFIRWQDVLAQKLITKGDDNVKFYDIEPDGVLTKVYDNSERNTNTEVVIDTSGSMSMSLIKMVLRECKHILGQGSLRIAFCDDEIHAWHDIDSEDDIDELRICGRGGTNFDAMVNHFSGGITNKVVITDGYGTYPKNRDDVLWIIINDEPEDSYWAGPDFVNHIHINNENLYSQKVKVLQY